MRRGFDLLSTRATEARAEIRAGIRPIAALRYLGNSAAALYQRAMETLLATASGYGVNLPVSAAALVPRAGGEGSGGGDGEKESAWDTIQQVRGQQQEESAGASAIKATATATTLKAASEASNFTYKSPDARGNVSSSSYHPFSSSSSSSSAEALSLRSLLRFSMRDVNLLSPANLLGRICLQEPTFKRLLVVYRERPGALWIDSWYGHYGMKRHEGELQVKLFRDVPVSDIELLLPAEAQRPELRPVDRASFAFMVAAGTGGAITLVTLLATGSLDVDLLGWIKASPVEPGVAIATAEEALRKAEEATEAAAAAAAAAAASTPQNFIPPEAETLSMPETSFSARLAAAFAAGGVLAYWIKVALRYRFSRMFYAQLSAGVMQDNLVATNSAALSRVVTEAEVEQLKHALLCYFVLQRECSKQRFDARRKKERERGKEREKGDMEKADGSEQPLVIAGLSVDEICNEAFSTAVAVCAAAASRGSAGALGQSPKSPESVIASYLESEARVLRASATFGSNESVKVRLRKSLEVAEAARGLLVDSPPPPTAFFARDALAAVNSCGHSYGKFLSPSLALDLA